MGRVVLKKVGNHLFGAAVGEEDCYFEKYGNHKPLDATAELSFNS